MDKAHVEHAVRLVENETFYFAQSERIIFNEIKQSAGRGHKDIHAVEQRANLPTHRYAADRQRGSDSHVAAVGAEAVEDLARQLARWAEHQHPAALAHRRPWACGEAVQNRQCEGGGFASPSLGNSNHVAAQHDDRNRLRLDRCRNEVLFLSECAHDRVVKGEVMKKRSMEKLSYMRV